ncbi:MAG: peptidylprolyl isomerase [Candidatus Poribacteria bacterium]|nr:peptidylprolyl isomerase [Candidatus Poribacteria bacterium]
MHDTSAFSSIFSLKIIGCLALFLFSLSIAPNSAVARTFDQIMAYVNDSVITKWELDTIVKQRAAELQQGYYRFSEREAMQRAEQERSELLDRLIRQMLLVETALTLKIEITPAQVEQYLQNFKNQYKINTEEEFIEALKREGYTLIAFREQAKRNLMADQLVMRRILPRLQVRDTDVQEFFEENRAEFTTKADEVHLRHIFITFKPSEADRQLALQKIHSIIEAVKAGEDFEALAQRYADNEAQKARLGKLIELPIAEVDELSDTFRTALSTLNAGEMSEPIEGNEGLYLFRVERKDDREVAFRYLIVGLKPSDEAIQDAYERADGILQKLNQGEDFNRLAQRYSDDLETRTNGGDLGIRSLTELNPRTRKIIEGLSVGQYTTPIQTTYGVHIFKIDSRKAPELSEEEKNQIRLMLREQKFQEEWKAYTDVLMEHSFIKIKSLQ